MKILIVKLVFLLVVITTTKVQGQNSFFNVFDAFGITPTATQGTSSLSLTTADENWTESDWFPGQPWDEDDVFHTQLNHTSDDLDLSIRIGKGGQIYSWILEGTGELIPPQAGARGESPWVDDVVLQTWRDKINHDDSVLMDGIPYANGFVHGAGMYVRTDFDPVMDPETPFYHPLFTEKFDKGDRSYSCVNWGPVVKPSINRGDIMFYHKYRHIGDNVLEITYYGYNFGSNTYGDIAMPWAMMRLSVFANSIKSMPDGVSFKQFEGTYSTRFNIADAGGWVAKTTLLDENGMDNPSALTISTVHGLDKHYGESWQPRKSLCSIGISGVPNSTRDITIMTAFNNGTDVGPGRGFFKRIYMVLGERDEVIQKSYDLVDKVEYGIVDISKEASEMLPLYITSVDDQNIFTNSMPTTDSEPIAYTYALPVTNSVPLFLIKDNDTGSYNLTTDPYAICGRKEFIHPDFTDRDIYQPYDGKTEWVAMLGYIMPESDENSQVGTDNMVLLSDVICNDCFIPGEKFNSNELLIRDNSEIISSFMIQENETGFCSVDGEINDNQPGYTGDGFANTDNAAANGIDWQISGDEGSYTFTWRHAATTNRIANLLVNGEPILNNITLSSTGNWAVWGETSVTVNLSEGIKDIRLESVSDTGLCNIDYMNVQGPNATAAAASCEPLSNSSIYLEEENAIRVYSNLSSSTFTLSENVVQVEVYNMNGQLVKSFPRNERNFEISELSSGVYLLKVVSENGAKEILKIIKV
ncbi:T9SS type A sorting domain-containing protein [Cellulophaga sp. L1A9]|uniref:T9SS type A sorting domain-containing protein n=1 Tax=Cellulophaga sp. L1A9 TaxID=2686362 RepID=UPI00131AA897|nr:T9SS type A sorting domain-containing protein [Cellulophaga sp. L1A9]